MKLFIIDDDPSVRRTIASIIERSACLDKFDFEVYHYGGAIDAMLDLEVEKPDIVLLDIMMPGMTGLEMLTAINYGPNSDFDVIILTAHPSKEAVLQAAARHVAGFLHKPFSIKELERALEKVALSIGGTESG